MYYASNHLASRLRERFNLPENAYKWAMKEWREVSKPYYLSHHENNRYFYWKRFNAVFVIEKKTIKTIIADPSKPITLFNSKMMQQYLTESQYYRGRRYDHYKPINQLIKQQYGSI